jgi:predicted ATPase
LSWEFQKLQRLIVHLEDFERQSEEAYAGVKGYLGRLNGFFKDSSKEVLFNDSVNQICFRVLNKHDEPIGGLRDVDFLSSGEQQLLILFTFIKFSPGRVFVIDEPELSLHPKWQHHFLDAVRGLMPPGTQLILATHSPSIVGRSTGCCIPLLPYNE